MDAKKFEATLVERISSKSGKPYKCLEIKLTDTYKKVVFLDEADLEVLRLLEVVDSKKTISSFK